MGQKYGDTPELAGKYGQQRTIPDSEEALNAEDSLTNTDTNSVDLRGKWVYLVATAAGITIKRGDAITNGLPLAQNQPTEFWVDPGTPDDDVFRHSGSDGEVIVLWDSNQ